MSDTAQEKDPSIEEILASIRQIISDDEEEAAETSDDAAEEPVAEEPEDEVLELTEKVDAPAEVEEPEEDVVEAESEPEPEPEPVAVEEPEEVEEKDLEVDMTEKENDIQVDASDIDSKILTETAATAALAGFTKLARDIQMTRSGDGITLEDVVRAQLEPLLREWLDKNLPPMIEVLVEKELERLSKKALND